MRALTTAVSVAYSPLAVWSHKLKEMWRRATIEAALANPKTTVDIASSESVRSIVPVIQSIDWSHRLIYHICTCSCVQTAYRHHITEALLPICVSDAAAVVCAVRSDQTRCWRTHIYYATRTSPVWSNRREKYTVAHVPVLTALLRAGVSYPPPTTPAACDICIRSHGLLLNIYIYKLDNHNSAYVYVIL